MLYEVITVVVVVERTNGLRLQVQARSVDLLDAGAVDVVDDLQVPRQDPAEQLERPPLQRFGLV